PLLLPLIETYSYVFLGGVYEQYAKFVSYLFFIYALILLYYLIKRVASDNFALLLTYFLSSVPLYIYSASSGYSDIPLVFYSGLGILYLYQSAAKNSNNLFKVGCLLLCLGAWTKKEGLAILLIGFIYWLLFLKPASGDKLNKIVFFILSVILINAPWLIFAKYYGLAGDNIYSLNAIGNYPLVISKIKVIASFALHSLFDVNRWNIFWFIFTLALFYKKRHILKEKYLLSVIATYVVILIIVYSICINRDINWLLVTTFDRIVLVFIPWIIYLIGVLFSGDFSYGYSNQRREGT
ncbi:MAG: glycosyltransferase family 39 protein, partial [Candidatus Omnitrophica bacterium]|nr:glycosyltransferase family 39 protein [Candidatus Omnitrophota bacterium]